ncbi:TPA: hypothetical protein KEY88_000234 [Serratia marcescens]|nr:hypothetical protein [Serratia marcescens]
MKQEQTRKGGLSFFGVLALIFITLKLMGYIAWSWWWVTAPLWAPLAVLGALAILVFVVVGAITCWESRRK